VGHNAFLELNKRTIRDFNLEITNHPNVNVPIVHNFKYFSLGGEKMQSATNEALKSTNGFLFAKKHESIPTDNDGVFCAHEIEWG